MSYLEFFSELFKALSWPIASVVIVMMLRKEIGSLLSRIKKIKHKDSEIDLEQEVFEAKLTAADIPDLEEKTAALKPSRMQRLAEESPRGAILDAWISVEEAMWNYCKRHGVDEANKNVSPYRKVDTIRMINLDHGVLGTGVIEMLDKLRRIRNDAVHKTDYEITTNTANEYASLASRVTARLEEA